MPNGTKFDGPASVNKFKMTSRINSRSTSQSSQVINRRLSKFDVVFAKTGDLPIPKTKRNDKLS